MNYREKYIKYKTKYLNLATLNQQGNRYAHTAKGQTAGRHTDVQELPRDLRGEEYGKTYGKEGDITISTGLKYGKDRDITISTAPKLGLKYGKDRDITISTAPKLGIKYESFVMNDENAPYYDNYINGHTHALEEIFFMKLNGSEICYSDSYYYAELIVIEKSHKYANEKTIIENMNSRLDHLHSEEYINIKRKINNIRDPIYLRDKVLMLLSENSSKNLCLRNINNACSIITRDKEYNFIAKSVEYDEKFSYAFICNSHPNSGCFSISDSLLDTSAIIYKYQDPVVRMVCEYIILLNDEFVVNGKLNKDKINEYYNYLKEEKEKREPGEFWKWIRTHFIGKESTSENSVTGSIEGQYCKFGYGFFNCCSDTLRTQKLDSMYLKLDMFDLTIYDELKEEDLYKKFYDLYNRNRDDLHNDQVEYMDKTLSIVGMKYNSVLTHPEIYVKFIEDQELIKKYVAICQETINIIMASSGRAEGKVVGVKNLMYPQISLLEVIDKKNMTWIVRSERFHLSKSPCVHFGLKDYDITDKLINLYNLPSNNYKSNVILHSIGHALDRLYCGHAHITVKYKEKNQVVFDQIIDIFKIIVQSIKLKYKLDITYLFTTEYLKYINIKNLTTDALYYISINDIKSLLSIKKSNGIPYKIGEIFNFEMLRDDALEKYKDKFGYREVLANAYASEPIYREERKDAIIMTYPIIIAQFIKDFGLYDIKFSYKSVPDSEKLVMKDGCSDIKKVYGCQDLEKTIKYLIN